MTLYHELLLASWQNQLRSSKHATVFFKPSSLNTQLSRIKINNIMKLLPNTRLRIIKTTIPQKYTQVCRSDDNKCKNLYTECSF